VLVPPAVALTTATIAVDRLAQSNSEAVLVAAHTVDDARTLVEQLTAMERLAKQRKALGDGDGALMDRYEARRHELVEAADRLASLGPGPEVTGRLIDLRAAESQLHAVVSTADPSSDAYDVAVDRFPELSSQARAILDQSSTGITTAATAMRLDAIALERQLLREAAWVIPLVLALLLLAVIGLVRPLRSLDGAIRLLGSGDLDAPIAIRGPTDVRALGERLEWLRQQLLAVESDRVQLLRHVSHELKTPLTCIREGTQLLEDGVTGALSGEQREITSIIATNAAELGRRIEDLLRASELRRSGTKLDLRPIRLDEVVLAVLRQNAVAARGKGVRFETRLSEVILSGDPLKLRTVVDNLVTNAIKFSPDGGAIGVSLEAGPSDVVLAVEDDGPGVDPEERERVFETFYQGRATWMRQVGGTGLGLAIAREYARAHGGDVTIEDGARGARLVVRLPGSAA
jgi:two-component system sensor histidine kinase GlrK